MKLGKIAKEAAVQLGYRVLKEKQKEAIVEFLHGSGHIKLSIMLIQVTTILLSLMFLHSEVRLVMSVYLTYTLYR